MKVSEMYSGGAACGLGTAPEGLAHLGDGPQHPQKRLAKYLFQVLSENKPRVKLHPTNGDAAADGEDIPVGRNSAMHGSGRSRCPRND